MSSNLISFIEIGLLVLSYLSFYSLYWILVLSSSSDFSPVCLWMQSVAYCTVNAACASYNVCHPKNYVCLYDIIYRQQRLVKRKRKKNDERNLGLSISIDQRDKYHRNVPRKEWTAYTIYNNTTVEKKTYNTERRQELSVAVSLFSLEKTMTKTTLFSSVPLPTLYFCSTL